MSSRNIDSFEDLMDSIFGDSAFIVPTRKLNPNEKGVCKCHTLAMNTNAFVDKEGFTNIEIEMPGFNKEEIEITLEDGNLIIAATKEEKEEDDKKFILKERKTSCKRSFRVPANRTVEDFKVTYENYM